MEQPISKEFKVGAHVITKPGAGRLLNSGLEAHVIAINSTHGCVIQIRHTDSIFHVQNDELNIFPY